MCAPFSAWDPECAFLLSFSIHFVCSDFQLARWLHLHNCIGNGQAGLSPVQGPYVATLPSRPLWAQAPVALGSSLFNGVTPVWEQPGAQDTGRQLSKLAIFFFFYFLPAEPNHSNGFSGLAGRFPHPSNNYPGPHYQWSLV